MSTVRPLRESLRVLRKNRRLLAFPLLATATLALAAAGVGARLYLGRGAESSLSGPDVVAAAVGYLLVGFLLTCCNAALICAVQDALNGAPVRVGASCRRALRHWRRLLAWSLLSGTVLLLIRQLERIPAVGWIMRQLFTFGWDVATYLALPAMVLDDLKVVESTRRSARMVSGTFSRQVYGSLWIALPIVLSIVIGLLAFMLGIESDDPRGALAGGLLAVLLSTAALLTGATVSGIFRTILYREGAAAAAA